MRHRHQDERSDLAAHNLALADDIAVDSDEYFRRIDEGVTPGQKKASSDGRRPSSAAAPASGGGGAQRRHQVRLTKGEAASATDGTLIWNFSDPSGKIVGRRATHRLAEMARRKQRRHEGRLYDKAAGT